MSIHAIHRPPPEYNTSATSATSAAISTSTNDSMQAVATPIESGDPAKKSGDGPAITAMKDSLQAAGFTQANSGLSQADYEAKLHDFTHAAFDAAHAQKQADRVGLTGSNASNGIDMSSALAQVASAAGAGTAPQELQDAFNALQQTQPAGSAASGASLQSVLSGMATTTTPDQFTTIGNVVDTQA